MAEFSGASISGLAFLRAWVDRVERQELVPARHEVVRRRPLRDHDPAQPLHAPGSDASRARSRGPDSRVRVRGPAVHLHGDDRLGPHRPLDRDLPAEDRLAVLERHRVEPVEPRARAPALTPALPRRSATLTPRHSAVPIAPASHGRPSGFSRMVPSPVLRALQRRGDARPRQLLEVFEREAGATARRGPRPSAPRSPRSMSGSSRASGRRNRADGVIHDSTSRSRRGSPLKGSASLEIRSLPLPALGQRKHPVEPSRADAPAPRRISRR